MHSKPHSEEAKRKMSEAHKGIIPWNKGRIEVYSEDVRKRIAKTLTGKKQSEETKRKRVKALIGHRVSEETKRKISIANTGKKHPHTEETKRKLSEIHKRLDHHPSSKKGRTYKEIYGDKWKDETEKRSKAHIALWDKKGRNPSNRNKHMGSEYVKWRTSVFQRDNWTCQTCGLRGGYLEAHHIKSWKNYFELRLDINNGVTLCKSCHVVANKDQRRAERKLCVEIKNRP